MSAACSPVTIGGLLGVVALVAIAALTVQLLALVVREASVRVEIPPAAAIVVVVVGVILAVPLLVGLLTELASLAECPEMAGEITGASLFIAAAVILGQLAARLLAPHIVAWLKGATAPSAGADVMVSGPTIHGTLSDVLRGIAAHHGVEVSEAVVMALLPPVEMFHALPQGEAEDQVMDLAAQVINSEAVRRGSAVRITSTDIRQLVKVVA